MQDNCMEKHQCKYCGEDAIYTLKSGEWCCCKSYNSCPALRKKNSEAISKAHAMGKLNTNQLENFRFKKGEIRSKELQKLSNVSRTKNLREGKTQGSWKGKHLPEEMRQKLSVSRIAYIENNPNYGLKWYSVNGIKVQGTWEQKFAEYLTNKNIQWNRKRIIYQKIRRYTPDFYCKEFDCYFEVKGFLRDRDLYKMYLVLDEYPNLKIKMIRKEQLKDLENLDIFSLPNFQEIYSRESIDMTKFENVWR